MYQHEKLEQEIADLGILYSDMDKLDGVQGYYDAVAAKPVILIDPGLTYRERAAVAAEELGHHKTSSGDIIDDRDGAEARRQELRAGRWAVEYLIQPKDFILAFEAGVRNRYELAEYFGVPEHFLDLAVKTYREKYGYSLKISDEYELVFLPYFTVHRILS